MGNGFGSLGAQNGEVQERRGMQYVATAGSVIPARVSMAELAW